MANSDNNTYIVPDNMDPGRVGKKAPGCGPCSMSALAWGVMFVSVTMFTASLTLLVSGTCQLDLGKQATDGPWSKGAGIWTGVCGVLCSLIGICAALEVIPINIRHKLFDAHFGLAVTSFVVTGVGMMFIVPSYTECKDGPDGGYCVLISDVCDKSAMETQGLISVTTASINMVLYGVVCVYYGLLRCGKAHMHDD